MGLLFAALIAVMSTPGPSSALDGKDGNAYVNFHRDRLLDTHAQYKGLGNRVNAWDSLNNKQKWLFLLQTDLLGNRIFMRPTTTYYNKNNPDDGCGSEILCGSCQILGGQLACGSCQVWDPPIPPDQPQQPPQCWTVSAYDCYQMGRCYETPQPRTDYAMALENVEKLYEILAPNDSCGGEDNNRIFWQAKDPLIQAFRNRTMPEWGNNKDELKGPHNPFDNASATLTGRPWANDGPDGQAQFYSWDTTCSYGGQKGCSNIQGFSRGGAYLPADSRMFELDNDYNVPHDSSPLCYYGGQYAVNMYQNQWCSKKGNNAQCDWSYTPTSVSYPLSVSKSGTGTGTVTSAPAGITCGATCSGSFTNGTAVTLTASPIGGSTFAGWSGACSGTGTSCTVTMSAAQSVTAIFNVVVAGPQISAIVDGTNYSFFISPTTTITIFGSRFSVGGNMVQLQRSGYGDVWLYNGDGHYFWDYNGTQINASLDNRVASGTWNVTVRNSSGGVSSPYSLTIQGTANNSAYYCYSSSYPSYGYQNWLCSAAYHPTYCYTSNWQWTTCPSSGSSSSSVCGNGICEAGENGSNCGQDCCDQSTACGQTKQNQGAYYCRNMYYYEWQTGTASWHGFKWVTQNETTQMCNEYWEASEGSYYQTQYQCGGTTGKCHSIPGGYY